VARRWLAYDLLVVAVFVSIGRSAHDHGLSATGFASTAWPFAVGVTVAWLALVALGRTGRSLADGATVLIVTVAVGMGLRVVTGQGVAAAFVAVALAFLGACMVGGRLVPRLRRARSIGTAE
jgi:Protein of unknown function (DUF3054)